MATTSSQATDEPKSSGGADTAIGAFGTLVLIFLIFVLVKAVDPGHVKLADNPGFVELVLNNRTVLTVVRLAILFIAVYAAYSCFELIRGRRPASRFWLVQADEAAKIAQDAGEDALSHIRLLESELAAVTDDNKFLVEYVHELQSQLEAGDDDAGTQP